MAPTKYGHLMRWELALALQTSGDSTTRIERQNNSKEVVSGTAPQEKKEAEAGGEEEVGVVTPSFLTAFDFEFTCFNAKCNFQY
jgi:hypothetical protein